MALYLIPGLGSAPVHLAAISVGDQNPDLDTREKPS
jgi:hypothetical protein